MWATQQPYVDHYHVKHTINEKLNRSISTAIQRRFAMIHPHLRLDDVFMHLAKHRRLPPPYYMETYADRSRLADYTVVDLQAHRRFIIGRVEQSYTTSDLPTASQWLEEAMEIEGCVQAIHARGGHVAFVRFPTSGEHLNCDERAFPKHRYWDRFAARTSAVCIHFLDLPELSDFECPDTSHIDRSDAPRFTLRLAKVLKDQGLLGRPCRVVASDTTAGEPTTCRCAADSRCAKDSSLCRCRPRPGHGRATSHQEVCEVL
jgi:hypothetical protein